MAADKPRKSTLRDVAQRADVSIWTASTTFSNPARVAAATRQRVLDAADALGYAGPNPGARALALGRAHLIAFATGGEADRVLADPTAAAVAQGVLRSCSRAGFGLVLTGEGQRDDHLVDGTLRFRAHHPADARRPAVTILAESDDPDVVDVTADERAGALALTEFLTDLGHRRFAVLAGAGSSDRLQGVADHLRDLGPIPVIQTAGTEGDDDSRAAGEAGARHALGTEDRPTAIVALSDALALGALEAAHRLGLSVPEDVSIVGMDDIPGADTAGLTTVFVPYRPMGELAADLLIRQLDGEPVPHRPPALPTALSVRRSAGRPSLTVHS